MRAGSCHHAAWWGGGTSSWRCHWTQWGSSSNLALLFLLPWLSPNPFYIFWRILLQSPFSSWELSWLNICLDFFFLFFFFCLYFNLFYKSQEANTNTNTSRDLLIALGLTHRLCSGSWAILQRASLLDFYLPFYSGKNRAWCCWEILILCSAPVLPSQYFWIFAVV